MQTAHVYISHRLMMHQCIITSLPFFGLSWMTACDPHSLSSFRIPIIIEAAVVISDLLSWRLPYSALLFDMLCVILQKRQYAGFTP